MSDTSRSRGSSTRSNPTARWAIVAGLAACVVAAGVVVLGSRPGAPDPPLLTTSAGNLLRLGVLGATAAGFLLALRIALAGGLVAAFGAAISGALAVFEMSPGLAALTGIALLAPSVALVAGSGHGRAVRTVSLAAAGVACVALAAVAWWGHGQLYAATHPSSELPGPPTGAVRWVWSGGVTTSTALVSAKLVDSAGAPSLRVSTAANIVTSREGAVVRFALSGLPAGVPVTYAVLVDGRDDGSGRGAFRTMPSGPASFTVAFSSCARSGSNGAVFDAIRGRDPLLYLNLGDFFYTNIDTNDPERFRRAFDRVLTRPAQANLYRSTATDYVWDDHDFGPNDADRTSPAAPAAHFVYREVVPHHRLGLVGIGAPIGHAFTVGRVRFIVTDTRSARSPKGDPDDVGKTMLGAAQRAWFFDEMIRARDRSQLVAWVNPDPWIGAPRPGADGWPGYATERTAIAQFIARNGIVLVMLSGDTHAVAIDDGTNSGYAGPGVRGFPVAHGGALDRIPQSKGGSYSEGESPGGGRYATMRVDDRGGRSMTVKLTGWNWRGDRLVHLRVPVTLPARHGISGATAG